MNVGIIEESEVATCESEFVCFSMDHNAQIAEECWVAGCGRKVVVMVSIVGQVGDGVIEVDRAVLASKVTQLTILRLCLVADKVITDSIYVKMLAGAVTVAIFRNRVLMDVIC